ncbi:unnamed protein product [Amoebophrya sp. A120]|nr:unnamed protein product [Amoebophrya sp. A120]|eukprot:GSA120T00019385001.1
MGFARGLLHELLLDEDYSSPAASFRSSSSDAAWLAHVQVKPRSTWSIHQASTTSVKPNKAAAAQELAHHIANPIRNISAFLERATSFLQDQLDLHRFVQGPGAKKKTHFSERQQETGMAMEAVSFAGRIRTTNRSGIIGRTRVLLKEQEFMATSSPEATGVVYLVQRPARRAGTRGLRAGKNHFPTLFLAHHPQKANQSINDLNPDVQQAQGPRDSPLVDPIQQKEPEKCMKKCNPGPGEVCHRCNPDGSIETPEQKMKRLAEEAGERVGMDHMTIEQWKDLSLEGTMPECDGGKLRSVEHCRHPLPLGEDGTSDIDMS